MPCFVDRASPEQQAEVRQSMEATVVPAERTLCTEKTSGNPPNMAAKRKGGLKLNAICAKLSRQVVTGDDSQNAGDGDGTGSGALTATTDNSERGSSSHYDDGERPDADILMPEGMSLSQSLEEDQRRREAIEKWVNGEYADESSLDGGGGAGGGGGGPGSVSGSLGPGEGPRGMRANNGSEERPPEGVYMVQPKGCSDDEDENGDEPDTMPGSHDGSYHDDHDSDDGGHKDDSYASPSEAVSRPPPFGAPGEASALRDYAANTMNEFLHMFGYDDQQVRDELAKKISFDKLKAATSGSEGAVLPPSSASSSSSAATMSSEEATRRARFSKYEEYIRKLKAGETLPWPTASHSPNKPVCGSAADELVNKLTQEKTTSVTAAAAALLAPNSGCLQAAAEAHMFPGGVVVDPKQSPLAAAVAAGQQHQHQQHQQQHHHHQHQQHQHPHQQQAAGASHIQSLASRASKYDFFIQKLKMGESLQQQNGGGGSGGGAGASSGYKRPSKYDLENVKFLHLFKPGEGNPDMGGAIAFKTGKVGRPSKYDIRNIPKLIPGKEGPGPLMPGVLSAATQGGTNPGANPLVGPVAAATAAAAVGGVSGGGGVGAGGVGPGSLPGAADQTAAHLGFNTADYLKASFSKTDSITTGTMSSVKNGLPPEKQQPVTDDVNVYQKYIASWETQQKLPLPLPDSIPPAAFKRFSGSQHCGHVHCAYQYRDHYHCMDPECNYVRFTSKQDVIRHYNMHKKRDNSLQHGFMRFSPLDDCSVYYHGCHLNGKSTHYHCMQVGCNKVYTSTSDVMTHENFHKKNAQLINDGFQRFRATEDCGTVSCQFYGQKTTHFHCRRSGCTFTFKNKCDIEKHKSYHIKDDAYAKDGFKKFYKYEECKYEGCVYSKATNHFHCIRSGCGFTFTSTSQMTSHKRKHERRHIRSGGGMLGLAGHGGILPAGCGASSFLLPKEEHDDSSNDDLMDFSALSSKNSSLSASPTAQQQQQSALGVSIGGHLMPPSTSGSSSAATAGGISMGAGGLNVGGLAVKPTASLPPASRMSSLLSQALPSNLPVALSNSALAGANPFFPLMPRLPLQIPPSAAQGLIAAAVASSGGHALVSDSLAQSCAASAMDGGAGASTPTSSYATASSIMEKISASKGLISPMMARLAAAALKPAGANMDTGNGLPSSMGQYNLVQVKQEPLDGPSGGSSGDSVQEHSLDLSKKEHSNESNGHPAPANTSLLSSLMNKMSQVNPGFFSALNLKTELENSQHTTDTSEAAQYLSRVMGRPLPEKTVELWKNYLRRFDIDDFCEAQCDFLHKVHFHCLVEDCGALFSTVDGAHKHANFHFRANLKVKSESPYSDGKEPSEGRQSQLATSMSMSMSMANTPPMDVPSLATSGGYSAAAAPSLLAWKHLAGSIPQLPASMPNLAASSPLATTSLENAKPQVKPGFLQFQDNDPCLATDCKYSNKFHFHCLFGNCKYVCKTSGKAESHCLDHINPNNNLVNVRDQFSYYSLQCLCPNQHCEFRMRGHYHCLRPGCYFVTNITTKLPWHVKKHEKAERRAANGFKYFTKREECGRLGCKYNQVNSHFHCIREGCQFSFLLKHQMTSHARKHMRRMLGKNFDRVPSQMMPLGQRPEEMQQMASLAGALGGGQQGLTSGFSSMMDDGDDYGDYMGGGSPLGLSSESSNQDRSCTSTPVGNESSPAGPGCQASAPSSSTGPADTPSRTSPNIPQPPPPPPPPPPLSIAPTLHAPPPPPLQAASSLASSQASMALQSPALSSFPPALLRPPMPSLPYLLSPSCLSYSLLSASLGATRSVVMPTNTPAFSPIIATPSPVKNDVPIVQDAAGNTISIPTATGAKKRFWIIEDMSPFGKRRKTASSRKMLDEGMMLEGFRRYDLYEDCKDAGCQFSLKVTHYHCTRENCGYKFCGRTHMYKHAQHHDRVDNLVLDDFKRFKSSLSCHFPDCQFSGNSTHFHCLRCGFRCTDSTKVTAHRKHHGKQDVISAAGFCQFSSSADCEVADCKYKLKCSHFHCTYPECKHTVVGMSQMDSHKRKHEKQERGELPAASPSREGNHQAAGAGGVGALVGGPGGMGPLAVASVPVSMHSMSSGVQHGLAHGGHGMGGIHGGGPMYLPSPVDRAAEYEPHHHHHSTPHHSTPQHPGSGINLDSSLNLGTDSSSSLFFLKNAAGLGLNDSLDLSKKLGGHHQESLGMGGPGAGMGAAAAVAAASGSNGGAPSGGESGPMGLNASTRGQDDTTGTSGENEDYMSAEEEPNAEEEEEEEEEEDMEPEDDLNTDSYEDSMPEPDGEKDNGNESFEAPTNHAAESPQQDKDEGEP
ncbi:zinc finger protein castor homolog 1 isoform X2 [Engraulis encrasicolus]|uniref:zinc finger protein castor homolog 1 isoform X2 n=1 Tax=Engraulis encrasicolus TaxID=184585 RepID=UPI002FD106D0